MKLISSIVFVLVACAFSSAFGQELGFLGGDDNGKISANLEHQMTSAAPGSPSTAVGESRFFVNVPVWRDDQDAYSVQVKAQRTSLSDAFVFPDRGIEVPREFGTAELGGAWSRKEKNGDRESLSFSFGSAGQRMADRLDVPIVSGNAAIEKVQASGDSWILFLNFSNNRPVWNNIPIPGFAYSMKRPTYRLLVGAPFLFWVWFPDPLTVTAFASPFGAMGETAYRVRGPWMLYASTAWLPKAYQNALEGHSDRLLFDRKEAGAGVRLFLGPQTNFSIGYVYGFDRRFVLGDTLTDTKSDPVSLGNSGGVQVKARFAF